MQTLPGATEQYRAGLVSLVRKEGHRCLFFPCRPSTSTEFNAQGNLQYPKRDQEKGVVRVENPGATNGAAVQV
jgi:hypothetical protein